MPDFPWTIEAASRTAREVDGVLGGLLLMSVVLTVGIALMAVVFVLRYRRGRDADRSNPLLRHPGLEITWIAALTVVGLGLFAWSAGVYTEIRTVPAAADLQVDVTARQWTWSFAHAEGVTENGTLHLPAGRTTHLRMVSEDVIHSFFVPDFRVKQDAVPGRYTNLWLEPERPGEHRILCAEYCGVQHSRMRAKLVVLAADDYDAWLADAAEAQAARSPAAAGRQLYESLGCGQCHRKGGVGPVLAGRFGSERPLADGSTVTFDADYVRESLLEPGARVARGYDPVMPSFQGRVDERQIRQITAYLKSLGESRGEREESP